MKVSSLYRAVCCALALLVLVALAACVAPPLSRPPGNAALIAVQTAAPTEQAPTAAPAQSAPAPKSAPVVSAQQAAFMKALEDQGFFVQSGQMTQLNVLDLCCSGQLPSCNAFNADAPYKGVLLPKAPGQTVESSVPWSFRMNEKAALVIVGKTPPSMAYFSYEPWLNLQGDPQGGKGMILNANIGDAINNLTVNTDGPKTDPFDRSMIIVVTEDQGVDSRVRAAAGVAGYDQGIVNTSVLPGALLHLGPGAHDDEISLLHRVYLPKSQQDLDAYINTPQLALRVTLTDTVPAAPFPAPDLRVRGTGTTEMGLMPALQELRQAILKKYSNLKGADLKTSVWLTDGYDGLQTQVNEYLPTRDTIYLRTDPIFNLTDDPNSFAIIYGVNHAATGKATYGNASAYPAPNLLLGVASVNSSKYAGTAAAYLPGNRQAESLYVWKVARNCAGDPQCLEVKLNRACSRLNLNDQTGLWLGFRMYLEPQTAVGPAFTEVIYDRALLFGPTAGQITPKP
jgi:hypothetical protein